MVLSLLMKGSQPMVEDMLHLWSRVDKILVFCGRDTTVSPEKDHEGEWCLGQYLQVVE